MSLKYKNTLIYKDHSFGKKRRKNLTKEVLRDSSPFPNPLTYEDYDEEFRRWVEEDLDISFDGEKIPTYMLLSNQRFSEYMQTWTGVDNKKNVILNFKSISRENNPKAGTIVGSTRNIPGERTYLLKRVKAYDKNQRQYFIDYRMKQPFSVDIVYTLSIVTNKYELLNDFNIMLNEKFKAIDCYIRPKGHFVAMKLNEISDESEYNIDNRRYYSQSFNITVMGYIITESSFEVVETPRLTFKLEEENAKKSYAEIEDYSECKVEYPEESEYDYFPIILTVSFGPCSTECKFTIDVDYNLEDFQLENVKYFDLYVNGEFREVENLELNNGDEVKFVNVGKNVFGKNSKIILNGYDRSSSYKKSEGTIYPNKEYEEIPVEDENQP